VRLDIYVKDSRGNAYDIELQLTDTHELELRSRYYHSEMDSHMIRAGEEYQNLKQSIVIFICDFDLFKRGRSIYTFESICTEDTNIRLEDKRKTVFINLHGDRTGLSRELCALLDYFKTEVPQDRYTENLQEKVEEVKKDDDWRENAMTLEMKMKLLRDVGREEGLSRGTACKLLEQVCKKLRRQKTVSQIADELEEEEGTISAMCWVAERFAPEYDLDKVVEAWMNEKQQ
jgi:predicted transposase/invertase (TIGR01784 family)